MKQKQQFVPGMEGFEPVAPETVVEGGEVQPPQKLLWAQGELNF